MYVADSGRVAKYFCTWGLTETFVSNFAEGSGGKLQGGQAGDDVLGSEGDGDDLADEAEERGSVETRYWSMTHSRAERLPRR